VNSACRQTKRSQARQQKGTALEAKFFRPSRLRRHHVQIVCRSCAAHEASQHIAPSLRHPEIWAAHPFLLEALHDLLDALKRDQRLSTAKGSKEKKLLAIWDWYLGTYFLAGTWSKSRMRTFCNMFLCIPSTLESGLNCSNHPFGSLHHVKSSLKARISWAIRSARHFERFSCLRL